MIILPVKSSLLQRLEIFRQALRVSVLALEVDGGPDRIRRSEAAFVATDEAMTREAMRERVEAEAARRAIGRVAWVEEA